MDNLILSFNVVLPLCLCIALGYFLYRINMIEEATQKSMNKLVFRVFLPIYVFNSIYTTDIARVFDLRLVGLTVFGILSIFAVLMVLIPRIEEDNAKRGVMVQAIFLYYLRKPVFEWTSFEAGLIIISVNTGAYMAEIIRSGIQSALRKNPAVKEFRLGRYGEGEDGVTVVTMK